MRLAKMRLLSFFAASLLLLLLAQQGSSSPVPNEDDYYYDDYNYDYGYDSESEGAVADPQSDPEVPEEPVAPVEEMHEHPAESELPVEEEEEEEAVEGLEGNEEEETSEEETSEEEEEEPAPPPPPPAEVPVGKQLNFAKSCTQPPETGVCRGYFPMFYFDQVTRTCRQFVYGGCKGNENVHRTASECYGKCYPQGLSEHSKSLATPAKGSERTFLRLHDGSGASKLTFTGAEAGAKVRDSSLQDFRVNGTYQIQFYFRTDSPHGLIAFLRQESVPAALTGTRIQVYIYLTKGHLAVSHVYGNTTEKFIMEKGGLQGGNWHSAMVRIDSSSGDLLMDVDSHHELFTIESLKDHPGYTGGEAMDGFKSSMWIGGVSSSDLAREEVIFGITPFHGCLQDVKFLSGDSQESLEFVKNPQTAKYEGVKEHCSDNCRSNHENFCGRNSKCVEHFDHSTCSCFNSGKDGRRCNNADIPSLSLTGDGHVVHRLYEWMNRVESYSNLLSFEFKTKFSDSILFYASAEHPEKQHLTASITRGGKIYVEVDLGGGPAGVELQEKAADNVWHTLTLVHQHETIQVLFDRVLRATIDIPGEVHYFHFDPDFYLGNAPGLSRYCGLPVGPGNRVDDRCDKNQTRFFYDVTKGSCESFTYSGCGGNVNRFESKEECMELCSKPGLRSYNTFLGCLQNVFFNDISILLELQLKNKTTHYHGVTKETPLGTSCEQVTFLPVTFSTENASVQLTNEDEMNFHITISFKPTKEEGVIASGYVEIDGEQTEWELWHDKHYVTFYIHDGQLTLKPDSKIKNGHWQRMDLQHQRNKNRIVMTVNSKTATSKDGEVNKSMKFSAEITVGSNLLDRHPGFVGCIRSLEIGGKEVPSRAIVGTPMATRDVTFDNCKVLGPCERPNACEHGGKCTVVNNNIQCDCEGTGYTGRTCHFSLYRRSCEQYRQIGFNQSGIYKVDVDGNGPLPAAYVNCSFNPINKQTTTIVLNNLPTDYLVRSRTEKDVKLEPSYRDFTPDMMISLVEQSESCEQEIQYDCRRSPLRLSTGTWFSSPSTKRFTSFGSKDNGVCSCKDVGMCDKDHVACNCDVNDGLARKDVAKITDPSLIPVTSMTFLYERSGRKEDTEGRITLSPLKCYQKASTQHTASFTSASSFMEVPGWREGSLYLSFKTTSKRPVVAYQPASHPGHASFMISLAGDKELEFQYRHRDQVKRTTLTSSGPLNTGSWQEVRIEISRGELRFVLNSEEKLFQVDFDIVLDGSMYLGAIPDEVKDPKDDLDDLDGLMGCVRGLTLNDEVIDLKSYIRASAHGVRSGCQPACDPNPCHNGAECVERWGEYECLCVNPFAHSGKNCEKNINDNAVSFVSEASNIEFFTNDTASLGRYNLLTKSFLVNFRTNGDKAAILSGNDAQHNFVQLFLAGPQTVSFYFNYGKEVKNVTVTAEDGVNFNDGQSVQVEVKRTTTCTTLTVFTEGKTFSKMIHSGVSLIDYDQYEQFPFGAMRPYEESVYYPHSLTRPSQYFQAYIGSGDDSRRGVECMLNGLLGCIRGLQIDGQQVSLTDLISRGGYDIENVKQDCNLACDGSPCKNGGICTEDFKNVNNFHCECEDTSYDGSSCDEEDAYVFTGGQWLSAASKEIDLSDFSLELAFSAASVVMEPQIVLLLRSTEDSRPHDYLLVGVEGDGSLLIEAQFSDLDGEMVHGVKLSPSDHQVDIFDGYRHYLVVTKTDAEWTIKLDGHPYSASALRNRYEGTSIEKEGTALYVGGIEAGADDRLQHYENFDGCVSNVRIHFAQHSVYPLRMTRKVDQHIARSRTPPRGGSCSIFAPPGAPSLLRGLGGNSTTDSVLGPEWNRPSFLKISFEAQIPPSGHPARDTPMDNIVPAIAGTILIVALIIVLILLLRMGKQRRKKEKQEREDEEKQALLKPGDAKTTAVFTITEKQETHPLKAAPPVAEESKDELEMKELKDVPKLTEIPLTDAVLDAVKKSSDEPDGAVDDQQDSKRTSDATGRESLLFIDEDATTIKDDSDDESRPSAVPVADKAKVMTIGGDAERDSSSEEEEIDVVNVSSVEEVDKEEKKEEEDEQKEEKKEEEDEQKEEETSPEDGTQIDVEGDAKSDPEAERETPKDEKEEEPKDKKEEDSKPEDEQSPEEKTEEEKAPKEVEEDAKAAPKDSSSSSSSDSDDDFIELREEREQVQDARRMTQQVSSPEEAEDPPPALPLKSKHLSLQPKAQPEDEVEHLDVRKFYLTKQPSNPPALPPKEKRYF